jgi:hypothetical protein
MSQWTKMLCQENIIDLDSKWYNMVVNTHPLLRGNPQLSFSKEQIDGGGW